MSIEHDRYESPLATRYASREMSGLFSDRRRIRLWREIWLTIAKAQKQAGISITAEQVNRLENSIDVIDFDLAAKHEAVLRHDVLAHIKTWNDTAGESHSAIHLGLTSCDITDNADLIMYRDAMQHVLHNLVTLILKLANLADRYSEVPTVGYTHYQPAQITSVGKRFAAWCYDLVQDYQELKSQIDRLRLRGVKGAVGTQDGLASLLESKGWELRKIRDIENVLKDTFKFDRTEPITGQTYSRKVDARITNTLCGIATSVHKMCNDIRLLSNLGEVMEPFEKGQAGSSAMPHKRNPMRCERATSLTRYMISLSNSTHQTAAEQWLERTLDDSANRRIVMPEMFLATDAILRIMINVVDGIVVDEPVIKNHVEAEIPFLVSERVLNAAIKEGGDRSILHQRLREHANAARENPQLDFFELINQDQHFPRKFDINLLKPRNLMGLAFEQVREFLANFIEPIRSEHPHVQNSLDELRVELIV